MFLEFTPQLSIALENPLLGLRYPKEGTVQATVDTGFSGFVMIPRDVFQDLGLDQLARETRTLVMANGIRVNSEGAYCNLDLQDAGTAASGLVETTDGMEEILIGDSALLDLNLELNFCLRRVAAERCR